MAPTKLMQGRQYPKAEPDGPLDLVVNTVSGPWLGHCPDLSPELADYNAFVFSHGLVVQDGTLTLDSGWMRLEDEDTPSLPLGGFDNLAVALPDNWPGEPNPVPPPVSLGLPVLTVDYVQPVVMVAELFRADGRQQLYNTIAATGLSMDPIAKVFGVNHGTATVGFLWYLNNLTWENIPFDPAPPDASGTEMSAERDNLFDWAPYPAGGTQAVAGDTRPGVIIFTNKYDEVYCWDPEGAGVGAAPPGSYCSAFGQALDGAAFKALSVELFDGRLCFLNTEENGHQQYRRFRWTSITLTVPAAAPFIPDLTAVGSGYMDLNELAGEGLRILAFQDRLALYFSDGVAFANRTWNTVNPFDRQYVSKERGLLSRFAVCRLGRDLHFGLFTDGWFMLDSTGQWTEVGASAAGGTHANRWFRRWYSELDLTRAELIGVEYDDLTHRVRVSFPDTRGQHEEEPATGFSVWVYDIDTDTVWPDDWYTVTVWGDCDAQLTQWYSWADVPGSWAAATGRWIDYQASYGSKATVHGTEDGLVLVHTAALATRDGEDVDWHFYTHYQDYDKPEMLKTGDRIAVRHGTLVVDSYVNFGFRNQDGVAMFGTINLNRNGGGSTATSIVHPVLEGEALQVYSFGSGPIELYSFQPTMRPILVPTKDVT